MMNKDEVYSITVKHLNVLRTALLVALVFFVMPPFVSFGSKWVLQNVARPLQEQEYPVYGAGTITDALTGGLVTWPPFVIDSMYWQGSDLYMNGRLCKVQNYEFVSMRMLFGWPRGPQENARSEYLDQQEGAGNRLAVCQYWGPWVLKNAGTNPRFKNFFIETVHLPSHGLYTVKTVLGPFDFPPQE